MKTILQYILVIALSALLTFEAEYVLTLVMNDTGPCFFHDNMIGKIFLWIMRIPFFILAMAFLNQLFLPKYESFKERMIQREEAQEIAQKQSAVLERNFLIMDA